MSTKKPGFILKQIRGGRPVVTRPYKWAPGIPSLAIEFKEIPGESSKISEIREPILGTQDSLFITTQDGIMISINLA